MSKAGHLFSIPNTLTVARLLAVLPVICLFRLGHGPAAAGLFIVAMLTDCIDGWYAKRYGQETPLGLYLDPVVDKIVILALLYELANAGYINWAVPHLLLTRELLQNAVRAAASRRGQVIGANWMGKTKAVLQTVLVSWGLTLPTVGGGLLEKGLGPAAWIVLGISWWFFVVFAARNKHLFR